ncbi:thioredoxin domain-containing protein 3 homolog isoform X3 [Nematostella vectensis]|uniref:thioredoxin domain-containing protein 3 homolog isoform X3 n=1 Tax=Nematostella vectensis TaxID=45351 RepID=UPI002077429F|nr:thioredoxin domain-containing protein 3 homolog isoform X3 [Nematostella vectensis]
MSKGKAKELQVEVKSQEQWEELLGKEGLIVVDAYSEWCGPCKAIISSLKRLKNEIGDDLLIFAMAETDSIDSLEKYRMRSQPTFLFYAAGTLVNVIRGCHCPKLLKTIRKELDHEHKVLEGNAERVPFVDEEVEKVVKEEKKEEITPEEEEEEIVAEEMLKRVRSSQLAVKQEGRVHLPKQVTVAVIKPDAVKAGLVEEIIRKVEEAGIEVLKMEERTLTREEAAEFYKQHEGTEHFDQLVEFMSSGPLMTLALSKAGETPEALEGVIDNFRELIGPKDVNVAKEEAPNSLRAMYGTDTVMNAVHGCDSNESAARELAFFFPDFAAPTVANKRKKRQLQRTLALIRPDALRSRRESIMSKIQEAGFEIAMSKEMHLTREQAEEFYSEHKDQEFFDTLVTNMSSGPMMALCLAREDAIEGWRGMLGPKEVEKAKDEAPESLSGEDGGQGITSLRAQFQVEDSPINPLHGSDTAENAEKEIQKFFPMQSTVAVIKPEVEPDQRELIKQRIKEAGFKIQLQKEVTLSKELASQFYHEHEGKDFFEGLTDYMSSGPTMFMVLSKEDAVSGWRSLMGPVDPEQAKEMAPESIRAALGKDVMKNVVHGPSDPEKAGKVIKEFFPEAKILPDGTVKTPSPSPQPPAEELVEEKFNDPVGLGTGAVSDEAFSASSVLDEGHIAALARLNVTPDGDLKGGWAAKDSDDTQWLQVDLGKVYRICQVGTQGESGESTSHVKTYTMSYSRDGQNVLSYGDKEQQVFEGNSDQDTVVINDLVQPLLTQHIRICPKTWNEQIALRAEFYGVDAEKFTEPCGVESGSLPDAALSASSELDDNHAACRGRLNSKIEDDKQASWAAKENDENQWLQVNLGQEWEVTKVSTQGKGGESSHHVTSYTLSFSTDGQEFQVYKEGGEDKVFQGNTDQESVVSNWLCLPTCATHVRLHPKTWNEHIALRLEVCGHPKAASIASAAEPTQEETPQETPGDQSTEQGNPEVVETPPATAEEPQQGLPAPASQEDSQAQPTETKPEGAEDNPENAEKPGEVSKESEPEGDAKPSEGGAADGETADQGDMATEAPEGEPEKQGETATETLEGEPEKQGETATETPEGEPEKQGETATETLEGEPEKQGETATETPEGEPEKQGETATETPEEEPEPDTGDLVGQAQEGGEAAEVQPDKAEEGQEGGESKPADGEAAASEETKPEGEGGKMKKKPIVIHGPSGSGKSTLVKRLMKEYPDTFGFSVSHTTRQPRPGEINGKDYNFTERGIMEKAIENGEFLEFAEYNQNLYGTSKKAVQDVIHVGKVCILDIDVQGVKNVKKAEMKCLYIFAKPPSLEELENRLRGRGTETDDTLRQRLEIAKSELAYGEEPGNADYTIINDDLDKAYTEFKDIISKEIVPL